MGRTCGEPDEIELTRHGGGIERLRYMAGEFNHMEALRELHHVGGHTTPGIPNTNDADNTPSASASRAVQFHPGGGQFDFVRLPACTPHGGASYAW